MIKNINKDIFFGGLIVALVRFFYDVFKKGISLRLFIVLIITVVIIYFISLFLFKGNKK